MDDVADDPLSHINWRRVIVACLLWIPAVAVLVWLVG